VSSDLWKMIEGIRADDVPHRKGWKPSELSDKDVARHLVSEAKEVRADPRDGNELADVLNVIIHQAQRIGMSEDDLLSLAMLKLQKRFKREAKS
jgi:predicted house-cleaning noncanonical NTP pyrophosphatase (MazG superfamily)